MSNKNQRSEQGFTFVELLVCLAVVALVVGPICFSFLSSLKTRETAESINEATIYAEQLLEDIKVQITDDIVLRQKIVGNRVKTSEYSSIDEKGVGDYLVKLPTDVTERSKIEMTSFLKGTTQADLNTRYNTDDYAYEVILWKIEDVPFVHGVDSTNQFTLNQDAIKKATKLYTDSNAEYQFKASRYTGLVNPISFKLSNEMLEAFQDDALMYVPNQDSSEQNYKIIDKNVVNIIDAVTLPTIENIGGAIKIDSIEEIKNSDGVLQGYVFTITEGTIDSSEFSETSDHYRSIIELDVRKVLRNAADLTNNSTCDKLTFKFINQTSYNQLISIKQNVLGHTERNQVEQKFNIVVNDITTAKSTIIRTDDMTSYENYLIAVIVREKNPVLGELGKVVKKLIDIYSYDVTAYQRR